MCLGFLVCKICVLLIQGLWESEIISIKHIEHLAAPKKYLLLLSLLLLQTLSFESHNSPHEIAIRLNLTNVTYVQLLMAKAFRDTNKALPFLAFSFHVLKASGADALELNLSCPHGMGERGMGLACGQVRTSTAAIVYFWGTRTYPRMDRNCTLGHKMCGSDNWLETSRSALFKYLVLKKWKMRETEITATV